MTNQLEWMYNTSASAAVNTQDWVAVRPEGPPDFQQQIMDVGTHLGGNDVYDIDTIKEAEKVRLDSRADFVSRMFRTDQGTPLRFDNGREYLYPLYNVDWRFFVLMSSRQAEKSTLAARLCQTDLFLNKDEAILYATVSMNHVSTFARQKIDKQFDFNQELRRLYLGPNTINNIKLKRYANGSTFFLRPVGQSPESARGPTARKVYFDETQSIPSEHIPIVMEVTQSYPDTSSYGFLGTPLTPQNYLSRLYKESLRYEWIITCNRCFRKNPPLGKDHIDPQKPFLFCVYCGKEMNARHGKWVAMNPDSGKYPGFRISRLMTPNCRWHTPARDGVIDKYYDYTEAQFVNEVLGLPEGAGVQPVTEDELRANCGPDNHWIDPNRPPAWLFNKRVIATIDWAWATEAGGQSYTIFALWIYEHNKIRCIYAKRQVGPDYRDPDYGLREMVSVFNKCHVSLVGTDYGIGHKENIRLRKKLSGQKTGVFEFMYAGSTNKAIYNHDENRYHVGRTESLDLVFDRLKQEGYAFPAFEHAEQYLSDVLNVYVEYDPNWKRKKYEHAGTGPDDFLHLMNYARLTFEKLGFVV